MISIDENIGDECMYRRQPQGWLKHIDFGIIDFICMQFALALAAMVRFGIHDFYTKSLYAMLMLLTAVLSILILCGGNGYKGILKRGYLVEMRAVIIQVSSILIFELIVMFVIKESSAVSRLFFGYFFIISVVLCYIARVIWKRYLIKLDKATFHSSSLVLVTVSSLAEDFVQRIKKNNFGRYNIAGIVLLDDDSKNISINGIKVICTKDEVISYIKENWVDEVFFKLSYGYEFPEDIMQACATMGVTVHRNLKAFDALPGSKSFSEVGGYDVMTNSFRFITTHELVLKRMMDIAGGLVGCFITLILFLIVAPVMKVKAPGPVFFSQIRVGKNGKKFKIYKFRSMYMDAEERKKELMAQNKMDGFMFKMDDDPRIIKGIGHFIRKTSIDEFPQFWNILKGDMSLVGTRPPTVDEWEKYEEHHRKRLAIKPGLTGMWQANGRSDITDFEEVVKLDVQYIENWSIGLDIKLILKTVLIVLKHEGSV